MRLLLLVVPLLALACRHGAPPAPAPTRTPLPDATLACPAQYRFDRAGGRLEAALVLGDGPLALHAGVAEPRPGSRWVLLDGLGAAGDVTGDGVPETLAVVSWSPLGATGSIDHLLLLADRDTGPECLAAVALGDRERLLHVEVEDGAATLDGFTHAPDEPLALATQRVLAQLRFEGTPSQARARRVLIGATLPVGLERVGAALAPTLALPAAEGSETALYASGGDARVDARVFVPGPHAVELVLGLPATEVATATLDRLLVALAPGCAPALAGCLAAHRTSLEAAAGVRFATCTCGGLEAAAWGRASLQSVVVLPAVHWSGDPPWAAASARGGLAEGQAKP